MYHCLATVTHSYQKHWITQSPPIPTLHPVLYQENETPQNRQLLFQFLFFLDVEFIMCFFDNDLSKSFSEKVTVKDNM